MAGRDSATKTGRAATRPSQLRWQDWKAIIRRVFDNLGHHNVYLIAGGISFFSILALFPAIAALIGIYGLVADPQVILAQVEALEQVLPPDAYGLIADQISQLIVTDRQALSIGSVIAIALALWSTRSGVGAMMDGVNISYSEENERGFLAYYAFSLLLTLVFVMVVIVAIASIIIVPAVLQMLRLEGVAGWLASIMRWPVLILALMFALGVLYRYGPQRHRAQISWITWGASLATILWLVGSLAYSWYVSNFANYNATYGSLGAIVGLMLWFYVGAYAILLGAELNAEMEHQTAKDSTTGPEKPLGKRGAYVADHVPGHSPKRDGAYEGVENKGDAAEDREAAAAPKP